MTGIGGGEARRSHRLQIEKTNDNTGRGKEVENDRHQEEVAADMEKAEEEEEEEGVMVTDLYYP